MGEIDDEGSKAGEIKLDAHPESFQLEKDSPRIYVNLPKSRKIAVLDRETREIVATWPIGMALANYPMALDQASHRLFVMTRYPARLLVFDSNSGKTIQHLPAVGDCDDVFYDQTRKRIYAIGGEVASRSLSSWTRITTRSPRESLRLMEPGQASSLLSWTVYF